MDANRFENIIRSLIDRFSRRSLLGFGLAGGLGSLIDVFDADAKKKRKKKKKKRKKKPCQPDCTGISCGPNGCGGSCGSCGDGECQDGECFCPHRVNCSPGVCCATGQTCIGDACQACPPGPGLCDGTTLICGVTPKGNPCACTTTLGGGTACIGGAVLLEPVYCANCASNADCEVLLGLPGQAVCVGSVDCDFFCGEGNLTGCAVNGCVDVEFCDSDEDCSTGECITHRCQ